MGPGFLRAAIYSRRSASFIHLLLAYCRQTCSCVFTLRKKDWPAKFCAFVDPLTIRLGHWDLPLIFRVKMAPIKQTACTGYQRCTVSISLKSRHEIALGEIIRLVHRLFNVFSSRWFRVFMALKPTNGGSSASRAARVSHKGEGCASVFVWG